MHIDIPRVRKFAVIGLSGGLLLLSVTSCAPVPAQPHKPGEQLTWAEQHAIDVKNYQELRDARHQDRPCKKNGCP
jgi:hypothetical protein